MRRKIKILAAAGLIVGLSLAGFVTVYGGDAQENQSVGREDGQTSYIGRYVDGFTLSHSSDRGTRIEIENIEDGRMWASVYLHDYGSVGTTVKGKLEGAAIENGTASGTYQIAWYEIGSDQTLEVTNETGTFQIKLKAIEECSFHTFQKGSDWELTAYSPISFRYDHNEFEDFYVFEDVWDGGIASWFMESEEDLF